MNRSSSTLIASVLLALVACNSDTADEQTDLQSADANSLTSSFCTGVQGESYGAELTERDVVFISEILADPSAYDGKTIRVEGVITDVCPKRGCWFDIAGEKPGETLRFKVNDGEMVFPVNAKGSYATAEGTLVVEELTVEQARAREAHQAEEAGRGFDPSSITEGTTALRLQGTGAIIGTKM